MRSDLLLMAFSLCDSRELGCLKLLVFFLNASVQTLYYIGIDSLSLFVSSKMNEILEVQFQPAAVVY